MNNTTNTTNTNGSNFRSSCDLRDHEKMPAQLNEVAQYVCEMLQIYTGQTTEMLLLMLTAVAIMQIFVTTVCIAVMLCRYCARPRIEIKQVTAGKSSHVDVYMAKYGGRLHLQQSCQHVRYSGKIVPWCSDCSHEKIELCEECGKIKQK